jgi:hypothetical protein
MIFLYMYITCIISYQMYAKGNLESRVGPQGLECLEQSVLEVLLNILKQLNENL